MKKIYLKFIVIVSLLLLCNSVAYAKTASLGKQRKGQTYGETLQGDSVTLTAKGTDDVAYSIATTSSVAGKYVDHLSVAVWSGTTRIDYESTVGWITSSGSLKTSEMWRVWQNSSYRYVHKLSARDHYNTPNTIDSLTINIYQDNIY